MLAGSVHLTARNTKGRRERTQPKRRRRHEMDLHREARQGRDLNNKPDSAVLVLALKLGREILGSFPAGARGTRERAAE